MFMNSLKNTAARFFGDTMTNFVKGVALAAGKSNGIVYAESNITIEEMSAAYSSSWICGRVIDKPIEDAFREWREWQGEAEAVTALEEIEKRLRYKEKVKEARTIADVTGQAYLYMDIQGAGNIEEPLVIENQEKIDIRFLTVLPTGVVTEGILEIDPLDENYGFPRYYEINGSTQNVKIHPSRIAVFYGRRRIQQGVTLQKRADGILKAGLDACKQYEAAILNLVDLTFEAKIDVIAVDGLSNQVGTEKGTEAVVNRYQNLKDLKHNNGMIILDKTNEEYSQKQVNFSNLPQVVETAAQAVCGAFEIPMAILFGKSEGGLGSTGNLELSTYYDRINVYQDKNIALPLVLFDRLLVIDALGEDDNTMFYVWRKLWQTSSKEKSEIGKAQVETLEKMMGFFPEEVVNKVAVNMLTESGVASGLEKIQAEWEKENAEEEVTGNISEADAAETAAELATRTAANEAANAREADENGETE